jgi:hypothetical protein
VDACAAISRSQRLPGSSAIRGSHSGVASVFDADRAAKLHARSLEIRLRMSQCSATGEDYVIAVVVVIPAAGEFKRGSVL